MEKLTLGQVLDRLELDEVAVKVGNLETKYILNMPVNQSGLQYDTNDRNILKTLDGHQLVIAKYFKANDEKRKEFVIMKKELYNTLKGKLEINKQNENKSDTEEFDFVLSVSKKMYHAKLIKNHEGNEMIYRVRWDDDINHYSDYSMEHMNNRLKSGTWIKL
jgi:hypothetical protein